MSPIEVRNPRTGKLDYVIIPPPPKLLAQKCNRLRRSQLPWLNLGLDGRIEALEKWKQEIITVRQTLVDAVVADTGRLALSVWEVEMVIAQIERCCGLANGNNHNYYLRERDLDTATSGLHLWQTGSPHQLVGIISPYTFPLWLALGDAIPALLAGCAVVVKPSELTPRFIAPLVATLNEVPLLRDVLSLIEGNGETGSALLEYIDVVCFTGSLETGRQVAEVAAAQFIPAHLELGGKNAAIILESADVDLATSAVLWGACSNSGQNCRSISRIYVAEAIFEDFYHQLTAKASQLKFTYPNLKDGALGPIINYKQAQAITTQLEQACNQGAIVHCGGEIVKLDGGLWCHPTVLTQAQPEMELLQEETLAPIMPVMAIANEQAAIAQVNDSVYGHSACIFADDTEAAIAFAKKLEVGAIAINDVITTPNIFDGESQPFKFSGLGLSTNQRNPFSKFWRQQAIFRQTKPNPRSWLW